MVTRKSPFFGAFSSSNIGIIVIYSSELFLLENVQQVKLHNVSIKDLGTFDPFRLKFGRKVGHLAICNVIKVLLRANFTKK